MNETLDAPQVDEPAASTPDPADDLRAALSSAFDEVAGATEAEPESTEGPARDERGRFAAQADAELDKITDQVVDASKAAQAKPAEVAPEPPPIPADLAPIKSVLDEFKDQYAARGLAPAEAMRALFGAEKALRERPYEAIQVLARDFGVDLSKFAPAPQKQAPEAQGTTDPTIQALYQEVANLKGMLTTQQQQTQQAHVAEVQRVINEFAADPKHSHFQAVEPIMAALISNGQAKGLEAAYDMACRAHPEISRTLAKSETDAREKTERDARVKAAAEAKAKVVSVRGSPSVNGFAKPPDDLRGLLSAAWDGRVN
jgi:hypothetical protein